MGIRILLSVLAATTLAYPAQAQKSRDTIRVGVYQPVPLIDNIYNPSPETALITNIVFDALVYFDAAKREYKPLLAESFRRIDAQTYEFKIRQGVKFHNGDTLDADDVIYSIEAYVDPKNNFRFKDTRYGWIDKVEKIDPTTIRITSKTPMAPFLDRLTAANVPVYPKKVYSALENKGDFGRNPIGTGPYKVTSFNPAKGEIVYEKFDGYTLGNIKPAGTVKRIQLMSIADKQTQMARLMSGQQDIVYEVEPDQIDSLRMNPNIEVSVERTVSFSYVLFDTKNRTGIEVFRDKRVREALLKAIDRPALVKAFLPKEQQNDKLQQAMCHEWHVACVSSLDPVSYDPDGARKLLAEAGHAKGFDLSIATWGPGIRIAEAVSGMWKKVGVNAKVDSSTIGVYAQKRADGKMAVTVTQWDNGGAQPDVETTMGFFFIDSSRDYIGDKKLYDAVAAGRSEIDSTKREAIYREALDHVTREAYMMPLIGLPATIAHSKDVKLLEGHKSPQGIELNFLQWK